MKTEKTYFFDPYLKGIGQIMLQDNSITGLLFLLGIAINSPLTAFATLLATVIATVLAKLLKYDENNIKNGLYGFNAALIGAAHIVFFEPTWLTWLSIIVFSVISTLVMNFALSKKIPVFTFPFIFLTWITLFVFHNLIHVADAPSAEVVEMLEDIDAHFSIMGHGIGFGEVIFQGSLISGVIFFIAIYINSPISALYGLFGAFLGTIVALLFKEGLEHIMNGMFSFNPVLCAIVFASTHRRSILYVALAVILSVIIEDFMLRYDLSILTFPFVGATWLTLLVRDVLVKKVLKIADPV